jgi:hypothetical protein
MASLPAEINDCVIERAHMAIDNRGIFEALIGDGRPLLLFTGLALILSGGFAIFIAASGHFLPQDTEYLGMTAAELCALHRCRVLHFMMHDRVAWGGSLIAVGALYMWLAEFPLRQREAWAWWLFVVTGLVGFGSFLAYLGYGYLDTWHGVATLLLLPIFLGGLLRSHGRLAKPLSIATLCRPSIKPRWSSPSGIGRALLLMTAAGMIAGGLTIMIFGMTRVFVPQDLTFMGVVAEDLRAINPRLVPLIAHDRAGFGGGIATCGILVLFCLWCARPSRNLWQILLFAGVTGFTTAIGIHPVVGYNDLVHLAPAVFGAVIFLCGMILSFKSMHAQSHRDDAMSKPEPAEYQADFVN